MRARLLSLLLLPLLAMTSFATAQSGEPEESDDDEDDSSGHGSGGPGNRTEEEDDDDGRNSTEERCSGNSSGRGRCGEAPQPCDGNESESCRVGNTLRGGLRDGWVDFEVLEGGSLANYTVAGQLILERLTWIGAGDLELEREFHRLKVSDGQGNLTLHNNPTGLIRFSGAGGFDLDFPDGHTIQEGANFTVVTLGGTQVRVLFDNGTWGAGVLHIDGFWSLHVPVRGAASDVRSAAPATPAIERAIEERRIGAEVRLQKVEGDRSALTTGGMEGVEILAYDAVDVQVQMPVELATNETPIRVEVSSELDEGRTIVLNVDPALLESADPSDLHLAYYDVHDDGSETEVLLRMADSLADVLEANDDGGQPEYWVVSDANGLQVLVSVPHWSTHAITLSSIVDVIVQPSVIVGVVAGVAGSLAAAVLMVWPRRRHET